MERKDFVSRSKSIGQRKRTAAFPGNDASAGDAVVYNQYAVWPLEQSLLLLSADSYSLLGTREDVAQRIVLVHSTF